MRRDVVVGALAACGTVVVVSAVIALLEPHVPVLALGVLYVFAVLPVAVLWGTWLAGAVCTIVNDAKNGVLHGGADFRRPAYVLGW